jgi:hypothetical protein
MTSILIASATGAALLVFAGVALRPKKARFAFAEHEDHVALRIERHLGSDDASLVTMTFLREALRLRLMSDYRRFLIDVRHLEAQGERSFWLLLGGLGPMLLNPEVKVALVCPPRKGLGKRFREASIADAFPSERAALTWLRSAEPARPCTLDKEWVDSLLLPKQGGRTAPPLRKAA